jgi:hypothetical protein
LIEHAGMVGGRMDSCDVGGVHEGRWACMGAGWACMGAGAMRSCAGL